ncbi:PerC family transcriptional regulator [Citrobacter braakii]|uniref:PerC family transcriptional regulator n=1 Tax=Citrobacter braakii TaxID=57706 RepID=UPI004039FCED
MMVEDDVAQKLEAEGLWRRAASRWLDVMQHHALTDQQRDWIYQHRKLCLARAVPVAQPKRAGIKDVAQAADKTLADMGITSANGAISRQYRGR